MSAPDRVADTPVFFLAGGTGISAETLGNLMLNQFPTVRFLRRKIPFITTVEVARAVVAEVELQPLAGVGRRNLFVDAPNEARTARQYAGDPTARRGNRAGRWVAVIVEGSHACISSRGVGKPEATMVTSRMLGAFRDRPETRQEFLAVIGLGGLARSISPVR